ncbi:MAG: hypothetical protein JSW00_13825 [Thermoplasmata archaeon]|nr:MAG: hypothetical protein JSW00_13825 [Thermoplasmata archaeon]
MSICPYCGIGFFQPRAKPQYPPQRQPPSKTPSKGPLIIGLVLVIVVVIIIAVFAVILQGRNGKLDINENGNDVTMTYAELEDDITYNGKYILDFISLEPGDTLRVEDEIIFIASGYDESDYEIATRIWFKSEHEGEDTEFWYAYSSREDKYYYHNYDFTFKGNLTDDFKVGDDVVITLHVIDVIWNGYDSEFFEEMWNKENETPQNLPRTCIKKA